MSGKYTVPVQPPHPSLTAFFFPRRQEKVYGQAYATPSTPIPLPVRRLNEAYYQAFKQAELLMRHAVFASELGSSLRAIGTASILQLFNAITAVSTGLELVSISMDLSSTL